MTCMKLNRKPSKPNPPTPCNCMITLNTTNNEKKKAESIFFQSSLLSHAVEPDCEGVRLKTVHFWGRG